MAFLGGLITGTAKGISDRHAEARKYTQEQKIQDTRIQGEAKARQEQSKLDEQLSTRKLATQYKLDTIKGSSAPWAQKRAQLKDVFKESGASDGDAENYVKSLDPLGTLHDTALSQGVPVNKAPGTDNGEIDPEEYGNHLGSAMSQHTLNGGDPKQLDLQPHLPTLLGHMARTGAQAQPAQPAPQGQVQSTATFGQPGAPPGGAQGPDSPTPAPQSQGNQGNPDNSAPQPSSPSSGTEVPAQMAQAVPERDPYYGAIDLQKARELADITAGAGSARDVAKIKAQNQERLKREQGEIEMMQKMQGASAKGRPQHSYTELGSNGPTQHFDAGRNAGMVSGADIEEEFEHGGDGAASIDHSPNSLYMRREFPKAGAVEYHKVNNFGSYTQPVPDQNSPTGFSRIPLSKTGGVLGAGIPSAPPASQTTRQTSRDVPFFDPNTGQRSTQQVQTTSGPVNPGGALPNLPPPPPGRTRLNDGNPAPTSPIPSRPTDVTPPGVSALADVIQNDFTTGQAMLKNYPPRSPMRIAVQNEVNRRMAAGEGPVPVFLGTNARNQVQQAKLMGPEIDATAKEIDRISDKLGPVLGRWNDFLAHKVGTGDPDFQKLYGDLSLIKSKVSQIHFGSQSGIQAVERFDRIMSAEKMDAATLKAGLSSLSQILKLYGSLNVTTGAAMAEGGAHSATPKTAVPPPTRKSLGEIFK